MNKTANLKAMYADLKLGYTVDCNGCAICIRRSLQRENRQYIFYQYYGRSAKRLGISNLRFICSVIAKSENYEYTIID